MVRQNNMRFGGVFFWLIGSVCISPAIVAAQDEPVTSGSRVITAPADNATSAEDAAAATGGPVEVAPVQTTPLEDAAADLGGPVEVAAPADDGALPEGQQVEVSSFGDIDLHVKDLELTRVLQLLSMQSERNIVATRSVQGKISADLYGVGFYDALDAVLHPNGFGYKEKGNFIYVYTAQELEALEQAERKTVSKIVRLNYITAADASAFASPLLSAVGSLSLSGDVRAGMQPSINDAGANSYAQPDTVVIRDYQENIDEILAVLTELDQRPRQVLIEATILQARVSEDNALGVDFALFTDLSITDFTNPLGAVGNLISGEGANGPIDSGGAITATPGDVAAGPSSIKLGLVGNDAAVFIRALDSVTDTTVLATPRLLVLNRQGAELLVGEQLGYLSTTATETSTTQTVEFLDVGTQLTVRPFISDDDFIRLELKPSVSDGQTRLEGGFIIPDKTTNELTTNVIVRSGQTVVLGGLFKEDTTVGRRQVPGLGSIPLLGAAFRGQDDSVGRSEVIFLVKPTVLKNESLYAGAEHVQDSINMIRFGSREKLLPWSRERLTSTYMKRAQEHYQAGEEDKALWNVNLALYLDPGLVQGMRMKEQLTGEQFHVYDHGLLEHMTDEIIDGQLNEITPHVAPIDAERGVDESVSDASAVPTDDLDKEMQAVLQEAGVDVSVE